MTSSWGVLFALGPSEFAPQTLQCDVLHGEMLITYYGKCRCVCTRVRQLYIKDPCHYSSCICDQCIGGNINAGDVCRCTMVSVFPLQLQQGSLPSFIVSEK